MELSREQNVASYALIPLVDIANRPDYKASPTLAAGDVKIIRHTGAAWNEANIGTLPAVVGGTNKQVLVTLTATELNPDDNKYPILVQFVDQTVPKEWDDQTIIIWTRPVVSNMKELLGDAQSATDLKDFADAGYDPATNKVQGVVLVDTTTTNTDLAAHDSKLDIVDTVVDGIKTVTDVLPNSGALTDIDTGINNIEAKLPTNYIMGSSDQTDKDDEIDSIKVTVEGLNDLSSADVQTACDTAITANTDIDNINTGVNNIEAKLPTNYIMGSAVQTDKDDEIDSIKVTVEALNDISSSDVQTACDAAITANSDIDNIDSGVNTIEAKLPTNYIMGSSDQTDKDDEIDSIKTTVEGLNDVSSATVQSACDAAITANTDINNIDSGVDNIEAKLPTNYIMGSSVQTDKDDEIDAIKSVTDALPNAGALTDIDTGVNNIEAKLPTNFIMGSSDQTDKDDEIDSIKATVEGLNDLASGDIQTACDAAITANTDINNIDTGVDNIEAKLPTNYIMGSSDQTDNDTVIDGIKVVTDALPNAGALTDIDTGVNNIEAKLPSKSYLTGTANADGDIQLDEATGALPAGAFTNHPAVGLNDDAITANKFDETTAFPIVSADSGSTAVARVGADSDTLETLSDQIDGVQSSVDGIQNNTKFVATVPCNMLIPDSGDTMYKISAHFYDSDGNMEDPDNNEIDILYEDVSGVDKDAFFDDAAGLTGATAGVLDTNMWKMVKISTGVYETYYKLPSTATVEQWTASFKLEEATSLLNYSRSSNVVEENPGSTTLADNTANKDIIAEAMKERDVSGTGAVSGSIYKDINDNIDANETKIDTIDTNVDAIKVVTDVLPNAGALTDIDTGVNAIEAKLPTNYIMGSSDQTDKDDEIDAIKAVTDLLPNAGALSDIDTGVNNIEAKLPTNYIMGASDQTDNDTVIDAIKAVTDLLPNSGALTDIDTGVNNIESDIGTPISVDSGTATIAGMLTKIFDDNGGADFDATEDSLHALQGTIIAGVPGNLVATAENVTSGTVDSGSYTDTQVQDSTYFQLSPTGAAPVDVDLTFPAGNNGLVSVSIHGRYTAIPGQYAEVYAWDWDTSGWEKISSALSQMNHSSSDQDYDYGLLGRHKDPSTGNAKIRFLSSRNNAGDDLYLDAVLVKAVAAGATPEEIADAVYLKMKYTVYVGAIHIDTNNGVSGTDVGVHGIPSNPVNNEADAILLAAAIGARDFVFVSGSSMTLTQAYTEWGFRGYDSAIALNGQDVSGSTFVGLNASGVALGATGDPAFISCTMGNVTLPAHTLRGCKIAGDITLGSTSSDYFWDGNFSGVAGTATPSVIFASNCNLSNRHYSGGIEIKSMSAGSNMSLEGDGQYVLNASCTGGTLATRGNFQRTDNASGAVTEADIGRMATDQLDQSLVDIGLDTIEGKLPTNYIMGSGVQTDKDDEIDAIKAVTDALPNAGALTDIDTTVDAIQAVTDALPNAGALTDIDTGVNNIEAKLPSKSYLAGTSNADGDIEMNESTGDFNATQIARINTEADTALVDIGLDHLVSVAVTGTDVTDDSIIANMVSKAATPDWDTFDNTEDSLEALSDEYTGTVDANVVSIDGALTNGNNAILNLKQLNIQSDANLPGVVIAGSGTGAGIDVAGGATGNGIGISGGATSGNSIDISTTDGHGIEIIPNGSSKHGIYSKGSNTGTGHGIQAVGGNGNGGTGIFASAGVSTHGIGMHLAGAGGGAALLVDLPGPFNTGRAIDIVGGEDTSAVKITGTGTNSAAVEILGLGSEPGMKIDGGATGNALEIVGGSTSGKGIYISTTDGHGMEITPVGTNAVGIKVDAAGNNDAVRFTAGGNGAGMAINAGGGANSSGLKITGTKHGVDITSGPTGAGVNIFGDTQGIKVVTLSGPGIEVTGAGANAGVKISGGATGHGVEVVGGTNGHGILATGAGSGHGMSLVGGGTGKDIDAKEIDDIIPAIDTEVTVALNTYDSGNGVARQSSVDAIQNNTRFVATIPSYCLIPVAGSTVYKLKASFYDSTGNMEDPDLNEKETGTNTSTGSNKLYDTIATFQANGVQISDVVYNDTDVTEANVTAVDGEDELTLDADIFTGTGKTYRVGMPEFSIDVETESGTDKNALLFKEFAASTALDNSVKFSGYKELEREAKGVFSCYMEIASTEAEAQFMYDFACEEGASPLHFSRTTLVLEEAPDGVIDANVISIDDELTTGNNATLYLKELNIVNDGGPAIYADSDTTHAIQAVAGGNGDAINLAGSGSGAAVFAGGGTTGHGIEIAAATGNGIDISTTDGHGIAITPGSTTNYGVNITAMSSASGGGIKIITTGTGIDCVAIGYGMAIGGGVLMSGGTNKEGLKIDGNGTAPGMRVTGGTTSGGGVVFEGKGAGAGLAVMNTATGNAIELAAAAGKGILSVSGGNGIEISSLMGTAVKLAGGGANPGIRVDGGATGNGVEIAGGATSGDGVNITASDGDGFFSEGGTNGNGISAKAAGNGIGLHVISGVTGTGIQVNGSSSAPAINVAGGPAQLGLLIRGTAGAVKFESLVAGSALELQGAGADAGIKITGGATGNGVEIVGGSTSGKGISVYTFAGNGIDINTTGAGMYINSTGSCIHGYTRGASSKGIEMDTENGGMLLRSIDGIAMEVYTALAGNPGLKVHAAGADDYAAEFGTGAEGGGIKVAGFALDGLNISSVHGKGAHISGGDAYAGLYIKGGSTGDGLEIDAGSSGGRGINVNAIDGVGMFIGSSGTANEAVKIVSTSGHGLFVEAGAGAYDGIHVESNAGNGINIEAIGGHAIKAVVAGGGSFSGLYAMGFNTASGIHVEGGVAGHGVEIATGIGGGNGIDISTTDGHGINVNAAGSSKMGIQVVASDGAAAFFSAAGSGMDGIVITSAAAKGIVITGDTTGLEVRSQSSGPAVLFYGKSNGMELHGVDFSGLKVTSGARDGITIGSGVSGYGINITSGGYEGIKVEGAGAYAGMKVQGGPYGRGLEIFGGPAPTGGDGLYVEGGPIGDGIHVEGGSTSGNGISATANANADSGFVMRGHTTGKDIDAKEIDGTISDILGMTIDGTATFEIAMQHILAYCGNNINRAGAVYTYRNYDDTGDRFTLSGSAAGRIRT